MVPKSYRRFLCIVALTAGCGSPAVARAQEPSEDVTEPPPYESFLFIPLRIHILTATDLPEVDCHLSDTDASRILRKVNGIWNKAGIHWGLESLVRAPAARQAQFRLARSLDAGHDLSLYQILIPEAQSVFDGISVYYIHEFPVNGVWMGSDFAIVQETAKLRPVEGGIDEPVPRVTAHELGHALGLSHRQARTNLLASGTTGILLNKLEIEVARRRARLLRGAMTTDELTRKAQHAVETGEMVLARRSWGWLAEIPGEGSRNARRRLEELDPKTGRGRE